jgi:hypothetical protein
MMKKIWMAGALLLVLPLFLGLTVVYTNSAVVTWDNATGYTDGSPFLPADVIGYEVSVAKIKTSPIKLGEAAQGPYTVTLPTEGDWIVGVRTVRTVGGIKYYSAYLWSDETTNPFVLRFYKAPGAPAELRVQ